MSAWRSLAVVAALAALLVVPASGWASEERPTVAELEPEVMCLTCNSTIEVSNSPFSVRMRTHIQELIDEGLTKSQIKERLVAEFGEQILAAPPKSGSNLLAWLLPLVGAGGALVVVGAVLRRWRRARGAAPSAADQEAPLDPALEARIDEELARLDT
jgi:cytochrome c-type biogenesis protein CcmH